MSNLVAVERLLFFPLSEEQAKAELDLIILHQRPENQSRPTLDFIQQASKSILGEVSISGLHRILARLDITSQRGRPYIHSPDEEYEEKFDYLQQIVPEAKEEGVELLFQDEFTLINQAGSVTQFAPKGHQPLERRAKQEQKVRIAGAMNGLTGQTTIYQCDKMTIDHLIRFLQTTVEDYPDAHTIYMSVDGWPQHFHPSVQAALVPQAQPFEAKLPPSWKNVKPKKKYKGLNLPIQMVSLPTYASWLNPIEKLWKLLKKEVTHLFPFPDDFNELLTRSESFFQEFEDPSERLLQFCGLLKMKGIFYDALIQANAPFLNPRIN